MINHKTKFSIYKHEEDREYICAIQCTNKDEYIAYDIESELSVESLDTKDVLELVFMGELERRSKLTGRINLYIQAIE